MNSTGPFEDEASRARLREFSREFRGCFPDARIRSPESANGIEGKSLTTFCIGGPIALFVEIRSLEELSFLQRHVRDSEIPFRVIGAGSNVLISSAGFSGVIARLGPEFRYCRFEEDGRVVVGGAYSLMALSREAAARGLSGLEFAGGIPATLGGAMRMNAGAHGGEMGDVFLQMSVVDSRGEIQRLSRNEVHFSYRESTLPADAIVHEVALAMRPGVAQDIIGRRAAFLSERKKRQPLTAPSAGSIFRNPSVALSAGAAIEACGLKGQSCGGAVVSPLHANWIINPKRDATHADVTSLMNHCAHEVQARHGVTLVPELLVWDQSRD